MMGMEHLGNRELPCKRPLAGHLLFALAVEELAWGLPRRILEHPGEVLRVFEAQFFGHPVDSLATENEILGTHHHKASYVVLRTLPKGIPDDITKVTWRQTQFAGAVFHAWQSVLLLHAPRIIVGEHLLESAEDITAFSHHLLILAEIETVAVVEDEQDMAPDDVIMPERLRLRCQLPSEI